MAADFDTKFYDAKAIIVIAFGVAISKGAGKSGYAEGKFLGIAPDGPGFKVKKSADGMVTRYSTNEPVTIVKVRLMQSSASNAVFSAMYLKDQSGLNGAGVGSFLAKDNQGTSFFESEACWVEGLPETGFGMEPDEVEWTIVCTKTTQLVGGN